MTSVDVRPAFSETLRNATGSAHAGAQGSQFVRDLFAGRLSREQFASMVAQHYFIYDTLETTGRAMEANAAARASYPPRLIPGD